jgi:hypothetical protein
VSFALLFMLVAAQQGAMHEYAFARLEAGNYVSLLQPTGGGFRRIYHSGSWSVLNLGFSPDQELLALIELDSGVVMNGSYSKPPRGHLLVIDTTGKVLRRIEQDVQRYVWCGRTCLAFIVGDYFEGDEGFISRGSFMVDLATGVAYPIPAAEGAHDLHWQRSDSSVYFWTSTRSGRAVLRYHLPSRTTKATAYRNVDLSSGGTYYYDPRSEANDTAAFYETATNRRMHLSLIPAVASPVGWLADSGDYLLVVRRVVQRDSGPPGVRPITRAETLRDLDYLVVDVRHDRFVREIRGHVVRWTARPGVFAIVHNAKVQTVSGP